MSRLDLFIDWMEERGSLGTPGDFWGEEHHRRMEEVCNALLAQELAKGYPVWTAVCVGIMNGFDFREWLAQKEELPL